MFLRTLITPAFTGRNRKPLDFTAGYLFKLGFPTLAGLGDEKQDQPVPHFSEFVVCYILHTGEDEKYVLS
jgi:hypothetical protein